MSSITTIAAADKIGDSRSDINTNFSNLNTDKWEDEYLRNILGPFAGNFTCTLKRGTVAVGNTATEIVNNNTANTWIVVGLTVGNVDGTNAADLDLTVDLTGSNVEVVDGMEIAALAKVDFWGANNGLFVLQANDTIDMTASAASDLVADYIAIDLGEAVSEFKSAVVAIGTSATTVLTAVEGGDTIIASLWFGNIDGSNDDEVDIIKNLGGGGDTTIVADLAIEAGKIVVINGGGTYYDILDDPGTNDILKATAATVTRINAITSYIERT